MDSKISNLDLVESVTPDDVLPIVNNGITKKVKVSQLSGNTNLTTTQTSTNFTINSDTGTDASVPLGNGTLAGATSNDYTTTEKNKLAGIAEGAEVNVNADWNSVSGDSQILNKPTIPTITDYVPYTGATANVNLGEFGLTTGQVTLDVTPTGTPTVGTTQWNDSLGSSQTTLKGGTVILKNGVDLVARIVNKVTPNTTLTKASYQAVRVSGATGQRLSVELAKGDADLNSADTIGLVTETIATNQEGFIVTMGQIEDINTTGSLQSETWVDGDVLYLSPTTAGRLTNVKPNGLTGHIVVIGYVEYAHAIQGKIYVKIMNGWELDELHNVYINSATLANNNLLQYDSVSELWKNETLASAGIQPTITLTTTGTSGASTLIGETLNIPQYSGATDLAYTPSPTNGTVTSSTGNDAVVPLADATNAGLLKPAKFTVLENTSGTNTGDQNLSDYALLASPTFTGTPSLPTGTTGTTQTPLNNSTRLATTAYVEAAVAVVSGTQGVQVSSQSTFPTTNIATVTASEYSAFITAGTVSATTLYFITA